MPTFSATTFHAVRGGFAISVVAVAFQIALAQSATAGTSTPYLKMAASFCPNGINCLITFPAVPASSRLDIQMVGCEAVVVDQNGIMNPNQMFLSSRHFLQTTSNGKTLRMPLRGSEQRQFNGTEFISITSDTVAFSIEAGVNPLVNLYPTKNIFAKVLTCTISGQLVTLP